MLTQKWHLDFKTKKERNEGKKRESVVESHWKGQVTSFWPMRRKQPSGDRIWECFRPPAEKGGLGRTAALPPPPPPPWVEGGCVWSNSSRLGTTRQPKSYDILELLNQGLQFLHLLFCARRRKRRKSLFSKTTKFSLLWYCKHLQLLWSFRIMVIITLNRWTADFKGVWSKYCLYFPSGKWGTYTSNCHQG